MLPALVLVVVALLGAPLVHMPAGAQRPKAPAAHAADVGSVDAILTAL